jgi:hypothetical protein
MSTRILDRRSLAARAWTLFLALGSVLVPIAGAGIATAGNFGNAVVDTVAGPPVPAGAAIAVVAENFNDLNTEVQQVVERALTAHGYTVSQDAPLILSFDTEISGATADIKDTAGGNLVGSGEPGAVSSPYPELPSEGDGEELGREPAEIGTPQVAIPLGEVAAAGGSVFNLSFTLGQDGRVPIWQGSVTAALPADGPFAAARAMAPVLVERIGRTVHNQRISLD